MRRILRFYIGNAHLMVLIKRVNMIRKASKIHEFIFCMMPVK